MSLLTPAEIRDFLSSSGSVSSADQTLLTLLQPMAERLVKNHVGYQIEQATWTEYYPLKQNQVPREPLVEGYEAIGGRVVAYGRDVGVNRILALKQLPVRSITSLYENDAAWDTAGGTFPSDTLLTDGPDYQVDLTDPIPSTAVQVSWTGHVYRRSGSWSQVPRAIKVTYVAGLSAAEIIADYPEFRLAALMTVAKLFNEAKAAQGYASGSGSAGPVAAESLADWSVTYATAAVDRLSGMVLDLPDAAKRMLENRVNMTKYLGAA